MEVDTFEVLEAPTTKEEARKMQKLCLKLDLKGQKNFFGEQAFRFRKITEEEMAVYFTLLPSQTKLEEYNSDLIPLRVLEVVEEVKKSKLITDIQVWHQFKKQEKDPLLVGYNIQNKDDINEITRDTYILARWGEVLEEFSILKNRVVAILKAKAVAVYKAAIKESEASIKLNEGKIEAYATWPDSEILKNADKPKPPASDLARVSQWAAGVDYGNHMSDSIMYQARRMQAIMPLSIPTLGDLNPND